MQAHIFEEPREHPSATPMTERRAIQRQFTLIRYVVVLGLGIVCRAAVIDDSDAGIGILLDDLDSKTGVGSAVEIIYGGERRPGEIRHITEKADGYHVGIHWRTTDNQ